MRLNYTRPLFRGERAWHSRAARPRGWPRRQPVRIENLVFEGGGVKGIAYAGALDVLEQRALMAGVRGVAGTSAGAYTAMLVAVGCPAKQIRELATATNYPGLE